jgi:hypothetical protein
MDLSSLTLSSGAERIREAGNAASVSHLHPGSACGDSLKLAEGIEDDLYMKAPCVAGCKHWTC